MIQMRFPQAEVIWLPSLSTDVETGHFLQDWSPADLVGRHWCHKVCLVAGIVMCFWHRMTAYIILPGVWVGCSSFWKKETWAIIHRGEANENQMNRNDDFTHWLWSTLLLPAASTGILGQCFHSINSLLKLNEISCGWVQLPTSFSRDISETLEAPLERFLLFGNMLNGWPIRGILSSWGTSGGKHGL